MKSDQKNLPETLATCPFTFSLFLKRKRDQYLYDARSLKRNFRHQSIFLALAMMPEFFLNAVGSKCRQQLS